MNPQQQIEAIREKARIWTGPGFDEDTSRAVTYMLEEDEEALVESFYKDLEFGTGGLRGIMGPGTNRVNKYTIGMATQGLSNYLNQCFQGQPVSVAIAHDCRNNSRFFAQTAADVFSANGIQVYLFEDLRPTPELSFAVRKLGCQSGVVITASHNPKEYNGYKVYWDDGGQIISPHDQAIIHEVSQIKDIRDVSFDARPDLIHLLDQQMDEAYVQTLKDLSIRPDLIGQHQDLRIVFTPIHGTGVKLVPMTLKAFGFKQVVNIAEQDVVDGNFPTVLSPNPEEKAALGLAIEKAKEIEADLVMATDPDADRVGIAVNKGQNQWVLLNGNETGSILIYYILSQLKEKDLLKGNEFIAKTIVTTPLFNEIAKEFRVPVYEVLTGFKYIADLIRSKEGKERFIAGGEESYGYLVGDAVRDKDAVVSCALIAEAAAWARSRNMNLLDLLDEMYLRFGLFRERLISIVRKGKAGSEEIAKMMEKLRFSPPESLAGSDVVLIHDFQKGMTIDTISHLRYQIELPKSNVLQFITQDGTIVSIRPSGTEPKIKFYFSVRYQIQEAGELQDARAFLDRKIQLLIDEIGAK